MKKLFLLLVIMFFVYTIYSDVITICFESNNEKLIDYNISFINSVEKNPVKWFGATNSFVQTYCLFEPTELNIYLNHCSLVSVTILFNGQLHHYIDVNENSFKYTDKFIPEPIGR